jgi:hypothetical protein
MAITTIVPVSGLLSPNLRQHLDRFAIMEGIAPSFEEET